MTIQKVHIFYKPLPINHIKYTYFETLEKALSIHIKFMEKRIDQKEKIEWERSSEHE